MNIFIYKNYVLMFIFILLPNVDTSVNLINTLQNSITSVAVKNCDIWKNATKTDYRSLKDISEGKLKTMFFIHYNGNKKVRYKFNDFHRRITSSSKYNRNLPMIIIIHGYLGSLIPYNYLYLGDVLAKTGRVNVFSLDQTLLSVVFYTAAATNTRIVGEALGLMLVKFRQSGTRNFHLIGFSLGAHVAGFAGKVFFRKTSVKLDRISALDVAEPCFEGLQSDSRLMSSDANFVDAMHTNSYTYGMLSPQGHADYYMNGGKLQPVCNYESGCSHYMAMIYYAESVNSDQFLGVPCSDWKNFSMGNCARNSTAVMGFKTPTDVRGVYYLRTNRSPPFAKGLNGLK